MGGFVEKWIEQGKKQGLQQGLQEGLQEGRQQERRNSILDLIRLRFDAAPPSIADRLEGITDLETLRQVNLQAATADSLAAFEKYLETL